MDCEKFDEHVIDALYGELDELTLAALRRHVDGCSRCAPIWNGLNQTRERAILVLEEPSPGLERRILDAERATARTAPWHRKALRGIAWAGSFAMRPQFAMAAVLVLVVGSSLLFLRARPGTMGSPVSVTERGKPLPEAKEELAPMQQARGRAGGNNQSGADRPGAAAPMAAEATADHDGQSPADETLSVAKGAATASAVGGNAEPKSPPPDVTDGRDGAGKLERADALRDANGCEAAKAEYEGIARQYQGTKEAERALAALRACGTTAPSATATTSKSK